MKNSKLCTPWEHRVSRRHVLGGLLGGAVGLGLHPFATPALARQLEKNDKQVLFVWLDGGMSQLESWDPKPNTQFGGPFRAIQTNVPGIAISELLPNSAQIMDKLAIIRSVKTQDNSHSAGVGRIQRGDPKNRGVVYPYLGSAISKIMGPCSSGLPPYVEVKPGSGGFRYKDAGFLPPKFGSLAFGDGKPPENFLQPESVSNRDNQERNSIRERLNQRYAKRRIKTNTEASSYVFDMAEKLMNRREIFDEVSFTQADKERYGNHDLGRHMLVARNMLEAGIRFVKVTSYGWDTHGDNFNGHFSLMPKFDQAFAAIVNDLDDRGMLENVLVIAMSEFGRTPRINGHVGRDHWPEAWSLAMAGCGIRPGVAVGKTNDKGTFVTSDEHDIGHLFHTWFHALGIDSSQEHYMNGTQPLPIAHDDFGPIKELLA